MKAQSGKTGRTAKTQSMKKTAWRKSTAPWRGAEGPKKSSPKKGR